jgi:nucleoside-diphosphate-sugar epimerase
MYGPGDSFESDSSHVIPAIIKKIDEASDSDTVELWGNGDSTRDFLHVVDAAEAIVDACERYDSSDLVNLGTGKEVSIASLAETIKYTMGYKGSFVFEENKEKSRRCVDVSRARDRFGWVARIPLEMGIAELVSWWRERRSNKTIGSA